VHDQQRLACVFIEVTVVTVLPSISRSSTLTHEHRLIVAVALRMRTVFFEFLLHVSQQSAGTDSASAWHFEPIFVDSETLDLRIERSRRQP